MSMLKRKLWAFERYNRNISILKIAIDISKKPQSSTLMRQREYDIYRYYNSPMKRTQCDRTLPHGVTGVGYFPNKYIGTRVHYCETVTVLPFSYNTMGDIR